ARRRRYCATGWQQRLTRCVGRRGVLALSTPPPIPVDIHCPIRNPGVHLREAVSAAKDGALHAVTPRVRGPNQLEEWAMRFVHAAFLATLGIAATAESATAPRSNA